MYTITVEIHKHKPCAVCSLIGIMSRHLIIYDIIADADKQQRTDTALFRRVGEKHR